MADKFKVKQLYDESGRGFSPKTHADIVVGTVSTLKNLKVRKSIYDLSTNLKQGFTGNLSIAVLNHFVFTIYGAIDSTIPIPYDTEIVLASNIPAKLRSVFRIIPISASTVNSNRINMWLDEFGDLRAVIPSPIRLDGSTPESIDLSVRFNGTFFRTSEEG